MSPHAAHGGFPLHDAEKPAAQEWPFQHCFHNGIISTILDTADIQHLVTGGNQWIYVSGIIPDYTPARVLVQQPKHPTQLEIFSSDRLIHFTSFPSGIWIGKLQSLKTISYFILLRFVILLLFQNLR